MKLSSTQIRCLLAILSLTRMHEEVASKNVAKLLGVSRPSVHKTLDILCRDGYVEKQPYGTIRLSPMGQAVTEEMEGYWESLILMFSRAYGLDPDESAAAATALISDLKPESLRKLCVR